MVTEEKQFKYETKSVDNAAAALALGAEVTGIKKEEGDRFFTFCLTGKFDIEAMAMQLASRTLMINAHDVLNANRSIKSLIHSR